jgi:two-component sensor histidine kinase
MKTIFQSILSFLILLPPQYLAAQKLGADPFFDSIYVAAHTLHDTQRIRSYCNLSSMVLDEDIQLSRRFLDTAKLIFARTPTLANELKIYVEEGGYFVQTAQFETAYEHYKKAISLAESLGRLEYASDLRTQVGDVLMEMERYTEAEAYYLESLEKTKWLESNFEKTQTPDKQFSDVYYLYSLAYLKLANLYKFLPEKKQFIEPTLTKALQNGEKINPRIAADAHLAFAYHYISEKNSAKAAASINALEAIYNQFFTEFSKQMLWQFELPYLKGLLAYLNGDNATAITHLNQAVQNFEKGGNVKLLSEVYKTLTEVYQKTGNWQAALNMQSKFMFYNDSLKRKSAFQTINNLEAKYQNTQKQAEINQKQAQLAIEKKWRWGLLGGVSVLAFLSFLFYQQRKAKEKANMALAASNEKIQKQAKQLETMMRELHHRTKNNMQIVSSLLSLQTARLSDTPEAADAMRTGQARVEAMSLMHQRLYQNADIASVNFKEFAKDLTEKLAYAFGYDSDAFSNTLLIDAEILNVDTATPLGLILNELLTNSFKYAFSGNNNPNITLKLYKKHNQHVFHYADNGKGLPPQYAIENSSSFGLQLIASLSNQIEGTYRYWNENGFHFELVF